MIYLIMYINLPNGDCVKLYYIASRKHYIERKIFVKNDNGICEIKDLNENNQILIPAKWEDQIKCVEIISNAYSGYPVYSMVKGLSYRFRVV